MKTFLSIEVNEQKVRYILVEQGNKGMAFRGSGVSTLQVGPSAPGALASFIKELIASQHLKVERLFLTVNRRDTVVHQFNLGQVSKGDLQQIIPAEIEKIFSFADNEFDFVYQQYQVKSRNNVIFGAMTDSLLQYLLKEIELAGIPCREMEIAPLNLAGLLRRQEYKDGPQCMIILNDHITHLVVFEEQQIRYLYSTTVGEEVLDDRAASVNWGEEIKRALKSYVLETKRTVNKVWMVWDRDKSPDFPNYLHQELGINAKPLNFLEEFFGQPVNPVYTLTAVPLIYYLTNIKPSFSLNHFLRDSQISLHIRRIAVAATFFILITGAVLGAIIGHFNSIRIQAFKDTGEVQKQITDLQKQSADILSERAAYQAMRRQLLFQATYVQVLKQMSWSQALCAVSSELPKELSLLSFKVDETGVVTLAGETLHMESIAKLLRTIANSSVLERGQFSSLTETEINKKKVFRFEILANIKTGDHS